MKDLFAAARHALRHPYALLPGAPRGVVHSTRAWIDAWVRRHPVDIRRGPLAAWWEIEAPDLRSLPEPNSVDGFEDRPPLRVMPIPPATLYFLKGARIIGRDGVVISPDNKVCSEFTYVDAGTIDNHSIFRRRRFPAPQRLRGWYATLCYPSADAYYHWMVESLPRMHLLEARFDPSVLDGVFVPSRLPQSMRESLFAFGLREQQLIELDMGSHFAPDHLLVPGYCAGLDIPSWIAPYLRAKLGLTKHVPHRRVYVSRAGAQRRRVMNEAELASIARNAGFEVVRPETLTFAQQAQLFAEARVVVGPSGAALVNALFCAPGGHLVVLQPHAAMEPHVFYALASVAGLHYWDVLGTPRIAPGAVPDEHVDFDIDPQRFAQTLRKIDAAETEPANRQAVPNE